jgi:predicted DNA-binding transcriptional regulator AlpA
MQTAEALGVETALHFEDLIELSTLAERLKTNNILSKSTLYKIASENYDGPLFADFPRPRRIGGKWFWRWSEIDAWIARQWEVGESLPREKGSAERVAVLPVGSGRGRPSRLEENAAKEMGLSVKEWRKHLEQNGL